MDSAYQFLGIYVGDKPETEESLRNLLLRAGIELKEEDRPDYVFSEAETAPPPPEEKVETAKAGQMAPDFTAIDIEGNKVAISDYRGKVVVLDFWASWCGPCMKAMPHLQDVATKYKDQGVVVLGSSTRDDRKNFEKWIKANGSKYPDIIWAHDPADKGPDRASRALYGVKGIPTQFVIGRDGKIAAVTVGYLPGEVLVDAALAKAGIEVPEEVLTKAEEDLRHRERQ
jgi:thiol-disulfide isomerase/thioredoxin